MELLIIKGKSNVGKTTTAAMLHNALVEHCKASLKWVMLDHWKIPLQEKDLVPDFRSVFDYREHTVGIVSHGDTSRYAKQFIREMMKEYHVDILIVCSNEDGYNWNMLNRDFGEYVKNDNVFEYTEEEYWSQNKDDRFLVKENIVNKIIGHINSICDKL